MTPPIKAVELPNQIRLPYVEQGASAGVPVLFLHGFADSWRSFEPVLPYLPESLHALVLTQRGHGEASRPASGYRVQDFAADVAAFMDRLSLRQAVIVGHSMGSSVTQRFAIDYPERALGLVLIAAPATLQAGPHVREFWESTVSKLTDPISPDFVRAFLESTLAQPVAHDLFETLLQENLKVPAHVWRAAFESRLRAENEFSGELGRIRAPTLLVWGDQDTRVSRNDQAALVTTIAGSRLLVYSGAGHSLHLEEPEHFASDLVDFISELSA